MCFEPEEYTHSKHEVCKQKGCKKRREKCWHCDPDPTANIMKHAYCKDHNPLSKDTPEKTCKHKECDHLGCKRTVEKCMDCDPDERDIEKHDYCRNHNAFSKDVIDFAKNYENKETRPCCKGVKHLKCQKCDRWAERCDGCDPAAQNIETHLYCIYHDMFTDELYM